jgi:hypothetical protein
MLEEPERSQTVRPEGRRKMFMHNVIRLIAASVTAGVALVLGVATAVATEPRPESTGRSGIWPPVPHVIPTGPPPEGLSDWAFAAVLLVAAMATLAFHGRRDVRHA